MPLNIVLQRSFLDRFWLLRWRLGLRLCHCNSQQLLFDNYLINKILIDWKYERERDGHSQKQFRKKNCHRGRYTRWVTCSIYQLQVAPLPRTKKLELPTTKENFPRTKETSRKLSEAERSPGNAAFRRTIYTRQCCCTVCTDFDCNCHSYCLTNIPYQPTNQRRFQKLLRETIV